MLVIRDTSERQRIVKSVHCGAGDSDEAKCLSGHLGRDKTQAKILERFFWKGISFDVSAFVEICQENYPELRLILTGFMRVNDYLLKSVLDRNESISAYLERTGMENQSVGH